MHVEVTSFRLRSTSSGFWLGAMAGADNLGVTVTLRQEKKSLSSFSASAKGLLAGFIKPSAGGRFQGLIELVAERIVQKLGSTKDSVDN